MFQFHQYFFKWLETTNYIDLYRLYWLLVFFGGENPESRVLSVGVIYLDLVALDPYGGLMFECCWKRFVNCLNYQNPHPTSQHVIFFIFF